MGRLTKDRLQQFQPTQHATSEVIHGSFTSTVSMFGHHLLCSARTSHECRALDSTRAQPVQSSSSHLFLPQELQIAGINFKAFDLGGHEIARRVWKDYYASVGANNKSLSISFVLYNLFLPAAKISIYSCSCLLKIDPRTTAPS